MINDDVIQAIRDVRLQAGISNGVCDFTMLNKSPISKKCQQNIMVHLSISKRKLTIFSTFAY